MREDCLQNCILKVISSGLNVNEEIIKLFSTQSLSSGCNFNYGFLKIMLINMISFYFIIKTII